MNACTKKKEKGNTKTEESKKAGEINNVESKLKKEGTDMEG